MSGRRPTPEPRRTCIGCRRVRDRTELVRIVRVGEDDLAIGRTLPGRGAWLCADTLECGLLAARRGAFFRAFRAPVSQAAVQRLLEDRSVPKPDAP